MSDKSKKALIFINFFALTAAATLSCYMFIGALTAGEGGTWILAGATLFMMAWIWFAFGGVVKLLKSDLQQLNSPPYLLMIVNASLIPFAIDDLHLLIKGLPINNPYGFLFVALVPVILLNIVTMVSMKTKRI